MTRYTRPEDAQKVMDAITDFNHSAKDDPHRATAQSIVQLAFRYRALSKEDASKLFGLDKAEFEQRMPGVGLGLPKETRDALLEHIKLSAITLGAKPPKEQKKPQKQRAGDYEFSPASNPDLDLNS